MVGAAPGEIDLNRPNRQRTTRCMIDESAPVIHALRSTGGQVAGTAISSALACNCDGDLKGPFGLEGRKNIGIGKM